jgi:hypothetical protein
MTMTTLFLSERKNVWRFKQYIYKPVDESFVWKLPEHMMALVFYRGRFPELRYPQTMRELGEDVTHYCLVVGDKVDRPQHRAKYANQFGWKDLPEKDTLRKVMLLFSPGSMRAFEAPEAIRWCTENSDWVTAWAYKDELDEAIHDV